MRPLHGPKALAIALLASLAAARAEAPLNSLSFAIGGDTRGREDELDLKYERRIGAFGVGFNPSLLHLVAHAIEDKGNDQALFTYYELYPALYASYYWEFRPAFFVKPELKLGYHVFKFYGMEKAQDFILSPRLNFLWEGRHAEVGTYEGVAFKYGTDKVYDGPRTGFRGFYTVAVFGLYAGWRF